MSMRTFLKIAQLRSRSCFFRSFCPLHLSSSHYLPSGSTPIAGAVKTTARPRRSLSGLQAPLTLTKAATTRVHELLRQNPSATGLRISVRTRGCNGLSYTLDFCVNGTQPGDEVVTQDGVRIVIDRRAQLTLLGTEMDFQEDLLSSGFVFNNPNVKGTCGCGESFNV